MERDSAQLTKQRSGSTEGEFSGCPRADFFIKRTMNRYMSYNVTEWFRDEQTVSYQQWDEYRDRLAHNLNVEERFLSKILTPEWPQYSSSYLGDNGLLFIPDDAVDRIRTTSKPFEEFVDIVRETTKNVTGDDNISNEDAAKVGNHVISYFQGDVNLDGLDGTKLKQPTDLPEYTFSSVVITSVNDNGYEDWEIYTLEDPDQFFHPNTGSNPHMFKRIRTSDLTPTSISDVAVELQCRLPPERFWPKNGFVAKELDEYDVYLYEFLESKQFFESSATDISSSMSISNPYWLHTGIRW